jgi:tetratricopeptide (TPR) repeat protein
MARRESKRLYSLYRRRQTDHSMRDTPPNSFSSVFVFTVLGCLVFALYLPYRHNPLVFDSLYWFSPDNLRELAAPRDTDRLLSKSLTYLLYQLFDGRFPILRMVSMALHIATCGLLYLFFLRLLQSNSMRQGKTLALFAAAIFAVHPVNVFAVAYLGQQELILATLFSLLFLLCYQQALTSERSGYFYLGALFYLAAMLSKENVVMVPAIAAALTPLHRKITTELVRSLLAPFVVYAVIAIYFTIAESGSIGAGSEPVLSNYLSPGFLEERLGGQESLRLRSIATQCEMFFRYVQLMVLPYPGWMSIDVQRPLMAEAFSWRAMTAVLGFAGYSIACLLLLFRGGLRAIVGFALLWPAVFFATELVAIRISEIFVIYRGYLWLPGLCLAFTLAAAFILRHLLWLVMISCVVMLYCLAVSQLEIFSGPVRLWTQAVVNNRPFEQDALVSFRAYLNRGHVLAGEGEYTLAIDDYNRALALSPGAGPVYLNRGVSYAMLGRLQAAIADFDQALALAETAPDSWRAKIHANRANAMALLGQREEALADIEKAILLNPHNPEYRDNQRRMLELPEQ